ncbi:MAG: pilus assembly protein [Pseudomonadales bacterium]|nr:pilus assembly protein [Pseudomonadales bacterium]
MDINTSRKLSNKKITGQGMSEYLVIVGLLAVAGIAAMGFMGGSVRQTMSAFAAEFSGNDSGSFRDEALSSATEAQDNAVAGLDNYEENNNQISN